jgi:hypothetical protein
MSNRSRAWLLPAFAVLVILASCSKKKNKEGMMIPKDAAAVVHFNGESLSSKLPWDDIKKGGMFTHVSNDSAVPAFVKNILDNPDNSGIDIKKDIIFFFERDSVGGYLCVEGNLKDGAKFKQFNQQAMEGGSGNENNGISYFSKSPAIAGWNKDKFVYVVNMPHSMERRRFSMADDTVIDATARDLMATCSSIFALEEKNSLGTDEQFTSLMNKKGDIHFWLNTEKIYGDAANIGGMSMLKLDKLYEGNKITATCNFENGKIDVEYKAYMSKELTKIFKKYSDGELSEEMLKKIPSKNVAAVFAMHFDPKMLKELIEMTGMEGLVNIGMMTMGFSMDDIINANKGDFVVAVTDIQTHSDSVVISRKNKADSVIRFNKPEPNIIFATAVGDKEAFNKILKGFKRMTQGREEIDSSVATAMNDKYFVAGNKSAAVNSYLAGGNNNFDFTGQLTGKPFGGYIDIQYILTAMSQTAEMDSSEKIIHAASLKTWQNVYIRGGNYDDGAATYKVEVNMMDKNTNSLKTLNGYMSEIAPFLEAKHRAFKAGEIESVKIGKDTIRIPPPPPPMKKKKTTK